MLGRQESSRMSLAQHGSNQEQQQPKNDANNKKNTAKYTEESEQPWTICRVCRDQVQNVVCPDCVNKQVHALEIARQSLSLLRASVNETFNLRHEMNNRLERLQKLKTRVSDLRALRDVMIREKDAQTMVIQRERNQVETQRGELNVQIQALQELKQRYNEEKTASLTRANYNLTKQKVLLKELQRKLSQRLARIFLLQQLSDTKIGIIGLSFFNSGDLKGVPNDVIGTGLGYCGHLVQQLANYLDVTLPYQLSFCGSTSSIRRCWQVDTNLELTPLVGPAPPLPTANLSTSRSSSQVDLDVRPLYLDEDLITLPLFNEAVGWLNYSIVYLSATQGLVINPTEFFQTLPNLLKLFEHLDSSKSVDTPLADFTVNPEQTIPPMEMMPLADHSARDEDEYDIIDSSTVPLTERSTVELFAAQAGAVLRSWLAASPDKP